MSTKALLAADSISVSIAGRLILQNAYADAIPGTITAVVGRSGAGKTTLLKVMVGRRRPSRGHVRWDGNILKNASLPSLAQLGLVYHPDQPWLIRQISVAGHLRLIAGSDWQPFAAKWGILSLADRVAGSLSQGESRLVELALTAAVGAKAVVLDEPFRGLEPLRREQVWTMLCRMARDGAAVLYADHDVESVRQVADRLFSVERGSTRLIDGFKNRPVHDWYHAWPG